MTLEGCTLIHNFYERYFTKAEVLRIKQQATDSNEIYEMVLIDAYKDLLKGRSEIREQCDLERRMVVERLQRIQRWCPLKGEGK